MKESGFQVEEGKAWTAPRVETERLRGESDGTYALRLRGLAWNVKACGERAGGHAWDSPGGRVQQCEKCHAVRHRRTTGIG